jgi:hypothetical protein
MAVDNEHMRLVDVIAWIDETTTGLELKTNDRTMLASGCYDAALEYQAAIATLSASKLYGALFALLRVLYEAVIRGLWLSECATAADLGRFKRGILKKEIAVIVSEVEAKVGSGVISQFHGTAWKALNGFTHTGMHQVSRRHRIGQLGANYDAKEVCNALGVSGALGLIAAGQLISLADRNDLTTPFLERLVAYATP